MSKIKQTLLAVIEANTSGETPDLDQAAREQRDGTLYSLVPDNERRVLQAPGIITRNQAENDPETLYIFTDNTNRDSGYTIIPETSWYAQKYKGANGGPPLHYPSKTTAVMRGLDNARPVTTHHHEEEQH